MKPTPRLVAFAAAILLAAPVWGQVVPSLQFNVSMQLGDTFIQNKVDRLAANIHLVIDETGTFDPIISTLQSDPGRIYSTLARAGDVWLSATSYRDGERGNDLFLTRTVLDPTTDPAAFSAAVMSLQGEGGGDYPESGLYAVEQAAQSSVWQIKAPRVLIQIGDAPSHEDAYSNPGRAEVLAALNANHIVYNALDFGDMNDDPSAYDGLSIGGGGQAAALAGGTGGLAVFTEANVDAFTSNLATILRSSLPVYSSVTLDLKDVPLVFHVQATNPYESGTFSQWDNPEFAFQLTFTPEKAGHYEFVVPLLGDGQLLANNVFFVDVGAVPEPSTYGAMAAFVLLVLAVRRRLSRR